MTPAQQLAALAAAERAYVTRHRTRDARTADPYVRGKADPDAGRHRRDLIQAMQSYDGVDPVGRRRLTAVPPAGGTLTERRTA